MRNLDRILLAAALVLLCAAAAHRFDADAPAERGQLNITKIPAAKLSTTRVQPRPGTIRFAPPSAKVHGVVAAALYPTEDGHPAHLRGQNVVAVQRQGELKLGGWIRDRNPLQFGDRWLLHFALWCTLEDQSEPIWWTGWAELSISTLQNAGYEIEPLEGNSLDVAVITADAQAIPGASISVDPAHQNPGFSMQYASTGENGRVTLRGLDDAFDWRIALPLGAGPARKPAQRVWRRGSKPNVDLHVDLKGHWQFKPISLIPPFRGATITIEDMKGAWPTARWIPAGRLPTVCYAMWRSESTPEKVVMQIAGFPSQEFSLDETAVCRLERRRKEK